MLYEVHLGKQETYWWDEDECGDGQFYAKDDESARKFVATVIQRMNRKYWRMGEPRGVNITGLYQLEPRGYSVVKIEVPLWKCMKPFESFFEIREVLESFYPKMEDGRRIFSIMNSFNCWRPTPSHR